MSTPNQIAIPDISELVTLHKKATASGNHERAQVANSAVAAVAKAAAAAAEAEVLARFMRAV
jgi:hypothetical protein